MEKFMLFMAVVITILLSYPIINFSENIFSKYGIGMHKKLILSKKGESIIFAEFENHSQEEVTLEYSRLPFVDFFNPPGFSIFSRITIKPI